MTREIIIRVFILLCLTASTVAVAAESIANLRGAVSPADESAAPRMTPFVDSKTREVRNYPEQPPLIPHDVDGYRIDLKSNKCLSCHARSRTGDSGAPMVSITHFMDRDAQVRASISPRRYFCNPCHVPQRDVKPLVENEFIDIDTVLKRSADRARN
jgi:cytochrome c-type protein NapB